MKLLRVDEFMAQAISEYYACGTPFGKAGDFITAPEVSQMFGECVAVWIALTVAEAGAPAIDLIEVGGGRGTLMADILRTLRAIASVHISSVSMVETSSKLASIQQEVLGAKCRWYRSLAEARLALDAKTYKIVICNELLDALPIRQFTMDRTWREVFVDLSQKQFVYSTCHDAPPMLANILELHQIEAGEGYIVEYPEAGLALLEEISNTIIAPYGGAALLMDYGYLQAPGISTIQAVKQHQYHNIFDDVGEVDLSALVDFKLFQQQAAFLGSSAEVMNQREFLMKHGIIERAQLLMKQADDPDLIRSQLHRLIDEKDEMGELFKALIFKIAK
jgi:NADH dehydrogenase [ubiquinone] 1 alpha subcomplex assembly factor 7